ncbi:AraC family transcriptional regulator [Paraflavisolibacter sp. H34]|uniref:helix-turn-helix domain-containing protein n=1 Tax=Huijunlia imazamoxiresistens TaxID=3127457 RepID=UPI0030162081
MAWTLYIKDMVCVRCKMAVEAVLAAHQIAFHSVELGWASLVEEPTAAQKAALAAGLQYYQLELLEDHGRILVERMKTEILHLLHAEQPLQFKLSAHLSQVLAYNYTYLANTFSELEGTTLERYFILQRVERVKELIVYEDRSLNQIADELRYSSVSHLCQQFKKVTGTTPAEFRQRCQSGEFVWRMV